VILCAGSNPLAEVVGSWTSVVNSPIVSSYKKRITNIEYPIMNAERNDRHSPYFVIRHSIFKVNVG